MRAVMRRLRKEIMLDLKVSILMDSQDERDRQLFEDDLVEWFQEKLVQNDESSYFADGDRPQFLAMTNFLLSRSYGHLPAQKPIQKSGCKGKRSAKQIKKSEKMVS